MLHVVLDTTAYRADPKRNKAAFRALARLASAQELTLHIPEIVQREFVSQQCRQYSKHIQSLLTNVRSLRKQHLPGYGDRLLERFKAKIEKLDSDLATFAEREFDKWATSLSAVKHPIREFHGSRVVDAYFSGDPPFKEPKRRDDFPDAFAWQTVLDLAASQNLIYVVSSDRGILNASQQAHGVEAFETLEDFVASQPFQQVLQEHFASTNLKAILALLPTQTGSVSSSIEGPLIDELFGKTVHSDQIPDDNSEATIYEVGAPADLQLRTTEAIDHGTGLFVVPFSLQVECLLNYAIFKGDLYALPEEKIKKISTSDLNRHYYDAEEYYELHVEGSLSFAVDAEALKPSDLSQKALLDILRKADVVVDSVTQIEVVEEY